MSELPIGVFVEAVEAFVEVWGLGIHAGFVFGTGDGVVVVSVEAFEGFGAVGLLF